MSKEFFNDKAEEWDNMVNHNPDKIRLTLNWIPIIANPNILDVGSGTGVLIPFLKEQYGSEVQVTALDFAEKMLEVSKRKYQHYPNLQFVSADVLTYSFPENCYDLIFCYSVFPHFQDKKLVLQRLQKALRLSGRIVIFHSQSREAINNLHQEAGKEVKEDRLPPAKVVAELAESLGYQVGRLVDDNEMYLVEVIK